MKKILLPEEVLFPEGSFGDYHLSSFYKNYILEKQYYPYFLDEWYENTNYGKVDTENNSIYPKSSFIKSYNTNNSTQQNINFVTDAFLDLKKYYNDILRKEKIIKSSIYSRIDPQGSLENAESLYIDYIKNLYNIFQEYYINPINAPSSFNLFVDSFIIFIDNFLKVGVLNRSAFLKSKYASRFIDGLRISLESSPPKGLGIKEKVNNYISDPQFDLFIKTIPKFGFFIDKNNPWTIVFDLNTPILREYTSKYGLYNKKEIYDNVFHKAYTVDLENLNNLILSFWNNYVARIGSAITQNFSNSCMSLYEETTILTQISEETFKKIFNINWQLRMYVYTRIREEKFSIPQAKFDVLHTNACNIYKLYGEQEALSFINNKINELISRMNPAVINLTTEEEFYKLLRMQATKFEDSDFKF